MLAVSMSAVIGGAVLGSSACSSASPPQAPPSIPENALITLGVQAGPPPKRCSRRSDNIQDLVRVTEIAVPPGSDYRNRSPKTDPLPVVTDDNVAVTATLVSRYDVYPAFGFRLI
jgi:hypothetical protein